MVDKDDRKSKSNIKSLLIIEFCNYKETMSKPCNRKRNIRSYLGDSRLFGYSYSISLKMNGKSPLI